MKIQMKIKDIYKNVVEKICQADPEQFENIVDQERPVFANKLVINEKGKLYRFILDEDLATEKDYEEFCKYVFNYIGMDFEEIIGESKSFESFAKPTE